MSDIMTFLRFEDPKALVRIEAICFIHDISMGGSARTEIATTAGRVYVSKPYDEVLSDVQGLAELQ